LELPTQIEATHFANISLDIPSNNLRQFGVSDNSYLSGIKADCVLTSYKNVWSARSTEQYPPNFNLIEREEKTTRRADALAEKYQVECIKQ
jgi:hypothetical protein